MEEKQIFSVKDFWSENCNQMYFIGAQSIGKTFSAKKVIVENFIKYREKFFYLTHFENEIDEGASSLFSDMNTEVLDFVYQSGKFYIGNDSYKDGIKVKNGRKGFLYYCFGETGSVNGAQKIRKRTFGNSFSIILWDEFLRIDNIFIRNSAEKLYIIMTKVFRDYEIKTGKEGKLIALANQAENTNQLFYELGFSKISDFESQKKYKFLNKKALVYFADASKYKSFSPEWIKTSAKKSNSDYFSRYMENVAREDDFTDFVCEEFTMARPTFFVRLNKRNYAFCRHKNNLWIIGEKKYEQGRPLYTLDKDPTLPTFEPTDSIRSAIIARSINFNSKISARVWFEFFKKN